MTTSEEKTSIPAWLPFVEEKAPLTGYDFSEPDYLKKFTKPSYDIECWSVEKETKINREGFSIIHKRKEEEVPFLKVQPSPTHGSGVFATQFIPGGSLIGIHPTWIESEKDMTLQEVMMKMVREHLEELRPLLSQSFTHNNIKIEKYDAPPEGFSTRDWYQALELVETNRYQENQSYLLAPMLLYFNHSCWPNITLHFNIKTRSVWVYASRDIPKDAECFLMYTEIYQTFQVRQSVLFKHWGFTCQCERCQPVGGIRHAIDQIIEPHPLTTNKRVVKPKSLEAVSMEFQKCITQISEFGPIPTKPKALQLWKEYTVRIQENYIALMLKHCIPMDFTHQITSIYWFCNVYLHRARLSAIGVKDYFQAEIYKKLYSDIVQANAQILPPFTISKSIYLKYLRSVGFKDDQLLKLDPNAIKVLSMIQNPLVGYGTEPQK